MSTTVFCKKYKEDLPALEIPPMPGQLGIELQKTVSAKAWGRVEESSSYSY